jgi:dienelactone hydrolase
MRWSDDRRSGGLRVRRFEVKRSGRRIPGVLWTPAAPTGKTPLVLLGHGASGHKEIDYIVNLGKALVRRGMSAAAIDGPVHGDRRSDPSPDSRLVFLEFCQAWSSNHDMTDDMVADWAGVLDALVGSQEFDPARVGWWGLSMGTIIGLPLIAAEPRIAAAVLGLMGMTGPTKARIAEDAPRVRCPTLFLVQWDDRLFGREVCVELFAAIGGRDKRMHVYPGGHGDVPREAFAASETFLADRLGALA